jgi:hypothetical protein
VKKPLPPPEFLTHDPRYAARLVEALTLLVSEHAAEYRLTQAAVLGSLSWVLGRIVGAIARDGQGDLEGSLDFLARQLRRAAVGEFTRRSYPLQ